MEEQGYGVQVMNVTENHTFELNTPGLEKLLLDDEIKDLPVVVVSVAGAYRGGKSFLLNFFIRYLESTEKTREDGTWLGEDSETLTGFKWRSGSARTTTGILMWSNPFKITLSNGEKVALLLMDTQGTFDNQSTVRDCSTIFALSTLLSSVQIYNLSQNIKEDDLQHLELFTEYGKMAKDQGWKPFQILEILVRDWEFSEDYSYGEVGGQQLLQERFRITPNLPKEMQDLRQHISSSFEKVSCFLMPHPGFKVLRKNYSGKISEIEAEFKTYLKYLVTSLLRPDKLMVKTMNGQPIRARDVFNYFQSYIDLFNSNEIPNPTNLMEATIKAGLLSIEKEALDLYEKGMEADCGSNEINYPSLDLAVIHSEHMRKARELFTNKKKMGSIEQANQYLDKLKEELEQRFSKYKQNNEAKVQTTMNKAKEAYEDAVRKMGKNQPLCVHPLDVEKVHKAGLDAAIEAFDKVRKKVVGHSDYERTLFIRTFEKQLSLLRVSNEQNNTSAVSNLHSEYWHHMRSKTYLDPPLILLDYQYEHVSSMLRAFESFDLKRNIPNSYTNDIYVKELLMKMQDSYKQFRLIHQEKLEELKREQEMRAEEERQRIEWEAYIHQQAIKLAELQEAQRRQEEIYLREIRRPIRLERRGNNSGCIVI